MKVFFKGLLYLSISVFFSTAQAKKSIQHPLEIQTGAVKIFEASHHKEGIFGERLTFRFKGAPLYNSLPPVPGKDQGVIKELQWFFPQAILTGSAKQFVQQMNVTTHPAYTVFFKEEGPIEGLMLTVQFDSSKVGFQFESGISPKGEPSVTLTFYDRGKLQTINARYSTVLNMACLDHDVTSVKKKYA